MIRKRISAGRMARKGTSHRLSTDEREKEEVHYHLILQTASLGDRSERLHQRCLFNAHN